MLTHNCYLLGFMGAGKSYIARHLAHYVQLPVIDLDALIEEKVGKSIGCIFEEEGEAAFRALEKELLHFTLKKRPCLVALGGGTPVYQDNMDWIKKNGSSIFLDPPISILLQRLKEDRVQRPLLASLSEDKLEEVVLSKLAIRRPIYERADLCIQAVAEELIIAACLDLLQS